MIATIVPVLVALAFAWSMGAHYTSACLGMPYATKPIFVAGSSVRTWGSFWPIGSRGSIG
ncbi:hypothetical protein AruPA_19465 [Acidiphilium sp. PA]|nr:hypothetical protein [Acidiphilium sp. PA]